MTIIEKELGNFEISHPMPTQNIDDYRRGNVNPFRITFVPNGIMNNNEALKYSNQYYEEIVMEAKKIIASREDFFKYVDIIFDECFTGTAYEKNDIFPNQHRTINTWCYPKYRWKEEIS